MSKADDILAKYGITQVRGSTGSPTSSANNTNGQKAKSTGNTKADDILSKYGITQVRGAEGSPTTSSIGTTGSVQSWLDTTYSFLKDAEKYLSSWRSGDDEGYASFMKRNSSLLAEAYGWRSQYTEDEEAASYLDEVISALFEASGTFKNYRDYYGQWETEDDYNNYLAYQKDYDDKKNFDIDAGRKEIDALVAELNGLKKTEPASGNNVNGRPYAVGQQTSPASGYTTGSTMVNGRPYAAGQQAQEQREVDPDEVRARELEKMISQKKQYLNQAKHIQEGITLAGVVDNADFKDQSGYISTQEDGAWNKMTSQYGMGYEDLTYEYINNQNGIRDEIRRQHKIYASNGGESIYEQKGYDHMNESEIAIYNYYYAKEGKEAAEKYLNNIQETLNTRKATSMYKDMEGHTAQELIFGVSAGFNQFASGMKNVFNTEDDYIAQSAHQIASGMVREDLADDGFNLPEWLGGASIGQVAYDTITTSANMAPSIMTSIVANMVVPGAGAYIGSAMMGASAAGGAYQEMLNLGYDKSEARVYSTLVGVSEAVLQNVLGGISSLSGGNTSGIFQSVGDKLLKNIDNVFARTAITLAANGLDEGLEEGLQEILTPWFQNMIMHTDEDVNWSEVAYSSLLGAITAGFMEGPSTISGEVNTYKTGKKLQGADISAQRLADIGKTFSADTVAYQLAGRVNENTGAYTLGRLFNEIGATMTEQNVNEITEALVAENMDERIARKNAEALAYVVEGGQLTKRQIAAIEANEVLAKVARTTLIEANTTWNQRAKGYNEILMEMAKEKASPKTAKAGVAEAGQEITTVTDTVDVKKENGAEDLSEVDTSPAKVGSITAIQKGKATIKLEDGSEVSAKDADLDPGDGVRIETIAKIDGISVTDANAVLGILRTNTGASAQMDSLGATEAYKYGRYGFSQDHMTKHGVFANSLTESQRQAIYEIGQRARQQQVASKQSEIEKSVREAQAVIAHESAEGTERRGRKYMAALDDGITALSLNESQKASYKMADQIAEAAKVNIRVYLGKTGEHGYYNPKTDEIYLNLNATNKSRKSMMAFTLGHELVHRAKKGSPAKYEAFASFLIEQYSKQGSSVETMIAEELAAAKEFGIEMSPDKAFEEVVCNACQRMLLDTDAGQKLAEFGTQSKQNKSFLEDVKRWITEFMDKLRSYFAGVDPDSMAAKEFAKFDENVKQILADMYVDMTIDAGENLSTIQNAFGKDTVVETNEHGEFTVASSKDGSEKLFNLVTWKNGGRETLEATLLREGYTEDEVKAALTIMDEKQRTVERIATELDGNGRLAFPEQGRINEATLTTDLKDGHSVLSALVSNGDYPVNIDLLMVCKKRKAYQRVINRLCETGLIQQATVDALAIAEINKILGKYGFETACLGCFVESRRLRIQEWAQTICKEWNAEVKKRNPNAKAFGFGKGEATLTPDEVMKLIGELESGGEKNDKGNLNLGQGSAVKRMGVLMDKVPSLQRTLSIEDLVTPDGLTSLRSFDSNLFSMVKSRYGSNSPKFVQEFNPYNHELAKYGKVPTQYENLREYLYAIGGARMQSFSDFIIENWFDYCQIVADLAARKLPMHTYTKEIALAKLFGLTGIKINMSLIPDVDRSLSKEFAGLTRNAKGELELIWADKDRFKATGGKSYMQSINFADAIALQNDPRYSSNVGTIAVGISDKHIEVMLDDARIRMIIPYHSSGMNPIFADLMGTSYYKDYTNFQNTTVKQVYNRKGQKVSLDLDKTQTGKLTSGFQFNEVLQDLGDARAAAEAYKEWCADASKHTITIKGETYTAELTPKFNDFSWHDNYYKLLEDFNTYDCISEQAARQGDVQQIYPEDFDKILEGELKAQEKHRQKQEASQAFDKAMGEIESYLKNHSKADTVYYANQHGIKLGAKDKKLNAAEKEKLKKLQAEGVSFKLPRMGDKKSPTTLTEQDLRDLLQKVKSREMDDGTYFPVRINTPDALLDAIMAVAKKQGITSKSELDKLAKDRPIAIQVFKARQSLATEEDWDENGNPHNLSIDDFVGMVKKMDDPEYIVYEGSTGRYVEVLKYRTGNGKDTFAVVELENFKGEQHLNGYGQDTYNILVTMYQPDAKKRVANLLNREGNIVVHPKKKKSNLQLTSGIHVPSVLNKSPFASNVPQVEDVVKNDIEKPSDNKYIKMVEDGATHIGEYDIVPKEAEPKKTILAWKALVVKPGAKNNPKNNGYGNMYPPQVHQVASTPYGVWLYANEAPKKLGKDGKPELTKYGRPKVKEGMTYRPAWHFGDVPYASQFRSTHGFFDDNGVRRFYMSESKGILVWALCEMAADENYQDEADMAGHIGENRYWDEQQASLWYLPENGYYKYMTNRVDPNSVTWYLSDKMRIVQTITDAEMRDILTWVKEDGSTDLEFNYPLRIDGKDVDPADYGIPVGNVVGDGIDYVDRWKNQFREIARNGEIDITQSHFYYVPSSATNYGSYETVSFSKEVDDHSQELIKTKKDSRILFVNSSSKSSAIQSFEAKTGVKVKDAKTVEGRKKIIEAAKKEGYDIVEFAKESKGLGSDVVIINPDSVIRNYKFNNVSERHGRKDAVAYKLPVGEDTSPRALLANAFDTVITNPIEKNKLQEYKENVAMLNEEEAKLRELREQIKELSFAKGPKDTKKIRSLQFEANQAANRINTLDKMLLRFEASAPLQNVLNREKEMARKRAEKKGKEALEAYREKAAKTQRELLERWQESRKRGIDSRQRTAMRHKIKDVVNELNQYLLKGTKDRHVPIGLQKAVAEALNAVNMDTVGADERIAKLEAELLKAKTPEAIREISKKIDNIREMGDRMDERLKKLKTAYDEFINSDDPLIANSHDDAVSAHMMRLIVRVGDTPLRDMTIDQLQDVYDVYKVVLATIRNANKSFKDNKNREISVRANQVMAEIDSLGVKRGKRPVFMGWIEKFGWDGLKPVYAMEHIGSQGLIDAYNNVRAGEDTWARDVVEAREYYLERFKKYKYDSWDFDKKHKFTSTTEKNFELTLDQIMSLYAYSKRDQAADHLKYGGIVFDPKTEVVEQTKHGIKVKYNVANATAYNISEETLADIISKLTPEQKGFVDEMQTYLSDVMGAKGNEVSLAMYDVKLFKEKNYFPLKSAHQYMAKAKEQAQGDVKIKNSGFSKETKPHAKNPIVLSSFMDVWANHVNEMSMYHAFVLPMEDFYRIYNYTTPSKDVNLPTEGVNASIENAYGSGATEYIEQMLKDLNGGARSDSRTGFINKMIGLFKKGAVFASLSVVIQQPSAIARAAALVDTKYFIGPKVDHKRHKALWDEVKQYAPVAIIKEMGYFDTNMGKSTQDYIMGQEYSGFGEKMTALFKDSNYRDEVLSKAPALADEIAWCGIWEAVKRETMAQYPGLDAKSEPFLMLAGSRFTEVIAKTQVYDSVLARSALMRSKDTGLKMATAFMAEPTTSINMVADALLKGKRGNRKYARTAIGAVIASQILNSILVSFVYAGRDDDEDETYLEKYIGTLTGEVLDSLNPAGYIPFIKDIVSIVQGYDVERSDMAVISDLWSAWQNLSKDNVSTYRKVEGFVGSICQIFGLPVKNIMRDARGIYQTVMSFVNGPQTTTAGIGYAVKSALPKWMGGGDVSDQNQLYEAIISGDQAQISRVKSRFSDESAITSAIRKALRENDPRIKAAASAKFNGDLDEYLRIAKDIIGEKHFKQDDVVAAINAEINALSKGETTPSAQKASGMFKAEDFAVAISQGDAAMANAIKSDIIQTAQKNGKSAEEAEKSFNSSAKAAVKEMFLNGDISEQKAISALATYCGFEQEDAELQVEAYDWEAHGYDGATVAAVREYNEHCAADNVPKDVYLYIRSFSNNTENDVDENGKTINYSAMKKVMAEIGAQTGLTTAQKYAIARSLGWAEKNIQKYKTW